MTHSRKNFAVVFTLGLLLAVWSLFAWCKPQQDLSASERRPLAQFPEVSATSLLNGSFMKGFESYATDQFPLRDSWRSLRAQVVRLLGQQDNHDIYLHDGYAAQMEYPLNADKIDLAAKRFQRVYDLFLADGNHKVYLSVIPDKGEFMGAASGHPALDYDALTEQLSSGLPQMQEIEIRDLLSLSDYYRTDSHWRQEEIFDVAQRLAQAMGQELTWEYETKALEEPFYGVYAGQSAMNLSSETLYYQDHPGFASCTVTNHETGERIDVYDMTRLSGHDLYEIFLAGPRSLVTIENPNACSDRELILFRDSFGSSIAPYFVECYAKVTLVDIRYLPTQNLGHFIDFTDQDVLFLYSSLVLNQADTLK